VQDFVWPTTGLVIDVNELLVEHATAVAVWALRMYKVVVKTATRPMLPTCSTWREQLPQGTHDVIVAVCAHSDFVGPIGMESCCTTVVVHLSVCGEGPAASVSVCFDFVQGVVVSVRETHENDGTVGGAGE
jgi:hypothetical protein